MKHIDFEEAHYRLAAVEMFPLTALSTALKQYSRWVAARNYLATHGISRRFLAGVGDAEGEELSECVVCQELFAHDLMEQTQIGPVCNDCFEDNQEDPGLCGHCSGSGEGMHDGSRCMYCRGSGSAERLTC